MQLVDLEDFDNYSNTQRLRVYHAFMTLKRFYVRTMEGTEWR